MKLSAETLTILKNFATINSGLLFKQGNVISTISPQANIIADATIKESFPQDFAVYDLSNFLSVISLFKDGAELEFESKNAIIKGMGGRSKIRYRFTDSTMIASAPDRRPVLSSVDVSFAWTEEDFNWVIRTANVLSSPNISVTSDGEEVSLVCFDGKDDSAHTNSMTLSGVESTGKYNLIFKTENLKMLPGSYLVEISATKWFAKFTGKSNGLVYYVSLEDTSSFN